MTDPSQSASPFTDSYSPQLRTALVLTGTGTAGAYHAGVLRALTEAGVKVDLVAGRGIGVIGALFSAIDGGQRLWDEKGFWKAPAAPGLYRWQRAVEILVWAVAAAVTIVALPLAAVALGLVVFPIDFVMKMAGGGAAGLVAAYIRLAEAAFAPTALPTWLPRVVVLVLTAAGLVVVVSAAIRQRGRRGTGAFWWRLIDAPLSADEAIGHCWRVLWDLIGGAAPLAATVVSRRMAASADCTYSPSRPRPSARGGDSACGPWLSAELETRRICWTPRSISSSMIRDKLPGRSHRRWVSPRQ